MEGAEKIQSKAEASSQKEDTVTSIEDLSGNPDYLYLKDGLTKWIETAKRYHYFREKFEELKLLDPRFKMVKQYETYSRREAVGAPRSLVADVNEYFDSGALEFGHRYTKDLPALQNIIKEFSEKNINIPQDLGADFAYLEGLNTELVSEFKGGKLSDLKPIAADRLPASVEYLEPFLTVAEDIETRFGIDSPEAKKLLLQVHRAGNSVTAMDMSIHYSSFAEMIFLLNERLRAGLPATEQTKNEGIIAWVDEQSLQFMAEDAICNGRMCMSNHLMERVHTGKLLPFGFSHADKFSVARKLKIPLQEFNKRILDLKLEENISTTWAPQHPQELALVMRAVSDPFLPLYASVDQAASRPVTLENTGPDSLKLRYACPEDPELIERLESRVKWLPDWIHYSIGKEYGDGVVTIEINPKA